MSTKALFLAGLMIFGCGGDALGPEVEAPYYVGTFQGISVGGFPLEMIGARFDLEFHQDLTCTAFYEIPASDIWRKATCVYDEPDVAHDSELRMDYPYNDIYSLHWNAEGDTLFADHGHLIFVRQT